MAGHIPCVICEDLIRLDQYRTARCWTDPNSITVAAHAACLIRIGEHELDLPPGETGPGSVPRQAPGPVMSKRRRPDGELEVHPLVGWRCPRCSGGSVVFYGMPPDRVCPKCVRRGRP